MADVTRTQWMWIIGIVVVLALGGLAYTFYSKGEFGARGVQFQTGFGVGAPSGNPHKTMQCTSTSGNTVVRCPLGTTSCDDNYNCFETRTGLPEKCQSLCKGWNGATGVSIGSNLCKCSWPSPYGPQD